MRGSFDIIGCPWGTDITLLGPWRPREQLASVSCLLLSMLVVCSLTCLHGRPLCNKKPSGMGPWPSSGPSPLVNSEVKLLKREVDKFKERLKTQTKELNELVSEKTELEGEVESLNQEIVDLGDQAWSWEDEYNSLKEDRDRQLMDKDRVIVEGALREESLEGEIADLEQVRTLTCICTNNVCCDRSCS